MKIKVSKATPLQIDYLMAKIEKVQLTQASLDYQLLEYGCLVKAHGGKYSPSTNWAQGGPLIDQHQVMFETAGEAGVVAYFKSLGTAGPTATGSTHLIAAMRLLIEGSYSEVVEIPDELCQPL